MKGGHLKVTRIGKDYEIDEAEDRCGIKVSWKLKEETTFEACHDVIVDATGQKGAFEKDPSPLTRSLREGKLVSKILVPFRNMKIVQMWYQGMERGISVHPVLSLT